MSLAIDSRPFETLAQAAAAAGHRHLLVLSGAPGWARDRAQAAIGSLGPDCCLWLGTHAPEGIEALTSRTALGWLGRESDLLVIDAFDGLNPDALGALTGTLRAGGLALLLCPDLEAWPAYNDPDYARLLSHQDSETPPEGHFLRWLAASLRNDPAVSIWRQGSPGPEPAEPVTEPSRSQVPCEREDCLTRDQVRAVEAIRRVVSGHRRRPLVLRADRGRGKSAALGIAAAGLLREGARQILVTAPRRDAVAPLFERLDALLTDARIEGNRVEVGAASLQFVAPDQLLADLPDADLLLVDEAAAIPAPLLERMLTRYSRCVFATTVHGYEGTGRGFEVRFRRVLDRITPQWRQLELKQPIRWREGDPLEAWLSRALLLDAEVASLEAREVVDGNACPARRWTAPQLVAQPRVLRQLFALLVQAHYRTTPTDLRALLDAPSMRIWIQRWRGQVVGVLLAAEEGGFGPELGQEIWLGRRRPRGHLLPQVLAAQAGHAEAAGQRYLRVVRIAVHPDLRCQGLGGRLLKAAERWARRTGIDMLGSSFGCTPDLVAFWRGAGYRALHLGLGRDASSGSHALLVARPLSPDGRALCRRMVTRFDEALAEQLPLNFVDLEPALVAGLLAWSGGAPPLSEQDWLDLLAFALGHRGDIASGPALRRLVRRLLVEERVEAGGGLVVGRILQCRSWPRLCREYELSGRREAERRLKAALRSAILDRAPGRLLSRILHIPDLVNLS